MKNGTKTYTCVGCGILVTRRCQKGMKYCSPACYHANGKTGRKKTGENISCKQCGTIFYASKNRLPVANFCSTKCHNLYQGRNKVTLSCKVCKTDYKISKSYLDFGNRTYCSMKCRDNDLDRNKMLIKMNQKQQEGGETIIEKLGYAILDELGFPYTKQHLLFNKFCVDAFVESKNLVIQFDGDYWHGNPEKFKTLDARQAKRKRLDLSQDAYIKKAGKNIIRFWGSEIQNNPEKVKSALISALF